jgi:hypothetical protein
MAPMTRDDCGTPPRRWGIAALAIAVVLAPRIAAAACGADAEARSESIRAFLDREAARARVWDLGWGIGMGAAAAGQGALIVAEWHPIDDFNDDVEAALYVGMGQSVLAGGSHVVLPLQVERPPAATGDACADLAAAERALRETAGHQKEAFILNHVGNAVFSVAGLLILGLGFDTWSHGATSAATSFATGLVTTYTMPRASWKAVRRGWGSSSGTGGASLQLRVTPLGGAGVTGLMLGGVF